CVAGHGQTVHTARTLAANQSQVTRALIVANVAAFVAQIVTNDRFTTWGILFGPAVEDGEVWRILASGFLHSGLLHIGFNMYALWIFGPALERAMGAFRFGLVYLAGLLGGSLAVLVFNFDQLTLGASGAVLGLAGGLAGALITRGVNIFQTSLGAIFLINLGLPLLVPRISFWGHLGGIAAGFLAALLLTWLPVRARQSQSTALTATVAFIVGLLVANVAAGGVL
ncbi:MAG: rhomboid family intramembrane serine protease, partial [Acidimicrobiia bacterium]|nr:rhomboid family intramembrane serine protease [Acidimicrobiia bacterium]